MPIQYPNFPKLNAADMGAFDLGSAIKSGLGNYNLYQEAKFKPRNLQEALIAAQQKNQMNAPYAENANRVFEADVGGKESNTALNPYRKQLLEAKIKRENKLSEDPFGGKIAPGDVGQIMWLKKLEESLSGGKENPYYVQAKQALELKNEQTKNMNEYRKALIETAPKRAATQLGKIDQELNEVKNGVMPGTNGTVKLEPEEQEILLGQYQLARQKLTSDVDTRKKLLYATNLDKTLDAINVDDLVQYGGIGGEIEKKIQQGQSVAGKEVETYEKYHKALTASKLLAKQVRQFYGDSITPGVQEQLAQLTNPASWRINPQLAKAKFNQFKDILKSETQTYRDATSNTKVYKNPPESNLKNTIQKGINQSSNKNIDWSQYDIPPGHIILYKKGKPSVFPPELVNQKLREGYDYE